MSKMKKHYKETKNYSDNIMDKVSSILTEEGIDFQIKSNGKEININSSEHTRDSICKLLTDNLLIPQMVFLVLLEIIKLDDTVFIRQKTT